MSSDVKIQEWAMKMAREHLDSYLYGEMSPDEAIALALLAAERRGLEKAAEVALIRSPDDDSLDWQVRQQVAAAIRSLGDKT